MCCITCISQESNVEKGRLRKKTLQCKYDIKQFVITRVDSKLSNISSLFGNNYISIKHNLLIAIQSSNKRKEYYSYQSLIFLFECFNIHTDSCMTVYNVSLEMLG